jgi:hypothetical protein
MICCSPHMGPTSDGHKHPFHKLVTLTLPAT